MCVPFVMEADSIAEAVAASVSDARPMLPLLCKTLQGLTADGVALTWSTATSRNIAAVLGQLQAE